MAIGPVLSRVRSAATLVSHGGGNARLDKGRLVIATSVGRLTL
jgi:hypothetical protein